MSDQPLAFGPFTLDTARGTLLRDGSPVAANGKGLLLLETLVRADGAAVAKADLMDAAWPGAAVEESNLSVQIAALRKLLGPTGDGGDWIATVPRVGYRFAAGPAPDASAPAPADPAERPSIAVLPLALGGGDPDAQYLADGITDDIITALTRFRWFRVAARGASFAFRDAPESLGVRYLLEGALRQAPGRLRITMRLADAGTGSQIWSERYDLQMDDIFAIQDEIAERVAGAIEPELLRTESRAPSTRHTGNMTAWDLVRKGASHFHKVTPEGHRRARDLFRQAADLDPDLPEAWIWLARVGAGRVGYGWTADPARDAAEAVEAGATAIRLDPADPYAHYAFAIANAFADTPETAILAADKSVRLNPSFALGHLVRGLALVFDGQAAPAVEALTRGLELNPNDPQNFTWHSFLALAHLFSGDAEAAVASAREGFKVRPDWRPMLQVLTAALAATGRIEDARRAAARLRAVEMPAGGPGALMRRLPPDWDARLTRLIDSTVEP